MIATSKQYKSLYTIWCVPLITPLETNFRSTHYGLNAESNVNYKSLVERRAHTETNSTTNKIILINIKWIWQNCPEYKQVWTRGLYLFINRVNISAILCSTLTEQNASDRQELQNSGSEGDALSITANRLKNMILWTEYARIKRTEFIGSLHLFISNSACDPNQSNLVKLLVLLTVNINTATNSYR